MVLLVFLFLVCSWLAIFWNFPIHADRRALLDPGTTAFLCYARSCESFPHYRRIFASLRSVIASARGWRYAMLIVALRTAADRLYVANLDANLAAEQKSDYFIISYDTQYVVLHNILAIFWDFHIHADRRTLSDRYDAIIRTTPTAVGCSWRGSCSGVLRGEATERCLSHKRRIPSFLLSCTYRQWLGITALMACLMKSTFFPQV